MEFWFAEARLEIVLALARLFGRAKATADFSAAVRVALAVGGGMVRDWRLDLGWMDGVFVTVPVPVLVCLLCCWIGLGREAGPLMVLPLARLRPLRMVTVAGMLLASVGPVLGDDLGGVLTGAGSLDFAV